MTASRYGIFLCKVMRESGAAAGASGLSRGIVSPPGGEGGEELVRVAK